MAREMHVDGQTLYFISDPGGSIARNYLVGPDQGIDVAQVMPWGKMIGDKSKSIVEDTDRNREVARRLALAWNATRDLPIEVLQKFQDQPIKVLSYKAHDEADSIESDLHQASLPRNCVHSLLNRLATVLT